MKLFLAKLTRQNDLDKDIQVIGIVGKNQEEVREYIEDTYYDFNYDLNVEVSEIKNIGEYEILVKKRVKI